MHLNVSCQLGGKDLWSCTERQIGDIQTEFTAASKHFWMLVPWIRRQPPMDTYKITHKNTVTCCLTHGRMWCAITQT